jgi:transcriptional regulator with XRE-family HTH domain
VERYHCEECGRELFDFGDGAPPTRCEDCIPETGPGSRLAEQLALNLRQLRRAAGITGDELGRQAGINHRQSVFVYEGDEPPEPGLMLALRFAHSLEASIDQLTDRIYWNPGETAGRPGDRRPPSERLSGFFLVLPASESVLDPAPPREPVANRSEAATIFGQNVRSARERRHLTQEALARAAGLSKAGLSLIERGICETTNETLFSLARSLEVTPEFLLGAIVWKPRQPPCVAPGRGGAQRRSAHSFDGAIKSLWGEGRTAGQIAEVLGTSPGDISAVVHRLRECGENLPYRNPPRKAVHARARRRRQQCVRLAQPKEDGSVEEEKAVETAGREEASKNEIAARLGANVKHCRENAGLSLRELGEATELDRSYLNHIERARNPSPRLSLVVRLAASLNVPCRRIAAGVIWEPGAGAFRVEETVGEPGAVLEQLGANALGARRRAGISQQALAVRASMDRSDVVDFERGNRNFRLFTAIRLAAALDIDFAALFASLVDWYVRPLPAPEYAPGDQPPTKAERDALLVRLWRKGRPEREIAEALDLKIGAVGPYVREVRDAGEHLPYRRPPRRPTEIAARHRRRRRPC